jgi:biopolymer transport protein ExbB
MNLTSLKHCFVNISVLHKLQITSSTMPINPLSLLKKNHCLLNKNHFIALATSVLCLFSALTHAEWNKEWTGHKKISINAQSVTEAASQVPVVVRLHSGNFDFTNLNIDGSDLRFVAADDKTELKYYIEKFDAVNELAIVWVQLPSIKADDKDAHFWAYYGNEKATTSTSDAKAINAIGTVASFHFAEKNLLQDDSATGLLPGGEITAQKAGLIAEAAVFAGKPLVIPVNPALKLSAGAAYTWSAWIKPTSLPQKAELYSQKDSVIFKIEDQKLSLNVGGSNIAGGDLKVAVWQHVAFTLEGGKANIYVDGVQVGSGAAPGIDAESDIKIGDGYTGEMDELQIANVARSLGWMKLATSSQGVESTLIKVSEAEAGEGAAEGEGEGEANYLSILVNSLTLDAKIVIGILAVMFAISAWVMIKKAMLVIKTDKDNKRFLARFQKTNAADLLSLDKNASYPNSTLFKLYQAGLREIQKRQHPEQKLSLSGASMDAIKAAIDADLVRETQKQNAGMVLLTIAISGGPFLGLLGTVVGVMITFAAIAAAGDVNVNAIAPGIAAALLATVAGLAVAIPALFGYNYLASRIKNITIAMQIFVDEFVTRSAELYGKE